MTKKIKHSFPLFLCLLIVLLIGTSQIAFAKTGLVKKNGKWVYVVNDKITAKTGLTKRADGKGGWYYVEKGKLCSNKAGITKRIDGKGGWFYVEKGKLCTNKAGITKRLDGKAGWFYVEKGKLCTNKAGLTKRIDGKGGWYYARNGKLDTTKTGLVRRIDGKGGWYYVRNGKLDTTNGSASAKNTCTHKWSKVYKTIHHNAITHKEIIPSKTEKIWHDGKIIGYQSLCQCGTYFSDSNALNQHQFEASLNGESGHSAHTTVPITSEGYYETVTTPSKTITIVDKPAYDEKVLTGYKCTKCGRTKSK